MPLDEAYFLWLYSQVGEVDNNDRSTSYFTLLRLLYDKEFTWTIGKDENRAIDGQGLRRNFIMHHWSTLPPDEWCDRPCSILEMLIALAWKLEWDSENKTQAEWFWVMLGNIGLTECTDDTDIDPRIVNSILDVMLNREYGENGAGGLFPLNKPNTDQRTVELYYQAETYLLERY